jgi:glycosyltransferase involved in cell wall biosynthesis
MPGTTPSPEAKKILVLTASHLCRNPRVVKEATTLGRAGYDVTVASVSTRSRFEEVDRAMMRSLPFRRQVINHTGDTADSRTAAFIHRGATWLARLACTRLRWETAHSLGPAHTLMTFARKIPADLTIVHTEIPIWAAQYLIHDGRRVAVDVEDWYSEDLLVADRRSRPIELLRRAESFALNRGCYTSTTSQAMSDGLAAAYGCASPIVLRNSFPLQPVSRVDRPMGEADPRFIWFSQTIGPGRGLELFLAAWAKTTVPSEVHLLGDERPGYREALLRRLPADKRARVHFIPIVAPEDLPLKLAEFDLGLALEPSWPRNRDITISNKILQYLNAGLAVVSTDTAGQSEVMHAVPDAGLLVQAHETTQLAAALDALLADRARLRAMQVAARRGAERQFCWEREEPRLLAAVAQALSQPNPAD